MSYGLAEAVTRLAFGDSTILFPRYHAAYTYGRYTIRGIRPSSTFSHKSVDGAWEFVTNAKGFRNREEFDHAKPPDTLRVLCLGDSHTQGYEAGQDSTFSAALGRYLESRGVEAEVINAGVSGFSTAEELVFLENEGFRYDPDAVVVGFFANDYEDNLKAGLFALDAQGHLVEGKTEHVPGVAVQNAIYRVPGVKWLGEHSHFYSLLFNGVWNYFKARLRRAAVAQGGTAASQSSSSQEYAVPVESAVSSGRGALAVALVERMQRFCESRHIRLIILDIPVSPGRYRVASSFQPSLRSWMDTAGIEYIDSGSSLGLYEGVAEMHVPHGHHHISEFTHTVLGVAIGRRLVENQ